MISNDGLALYFRKNFYKVITYKLKLGFEKAKQKNPDIILQDGSNDFLSENFFIQIKNKYKENDLQMFGFNKTVEENSNLMFILNIKHNKINDENIIFLWDGTYSNEFYKNRGKQLYFSGSAIGANRKLYQNEKFFFDADECLMELKMTDTIENVSKVFVNDVVSLNIKSDQDFTNSNVISYSIDLKNKDNKILKSLNKNNYKILKDYNLLKNILNNIDDKNILNNTYEENILNIFKCIF